MERNGRRKRNARILEKANKVTILFGNGGKIMDMRSYIMECLERHLSDYDLDGVELTEEDVDAVERQIIKNNLTLNNAIEAVLLGISNSLK